MSQLLEPARPWSDLQWGLCIFDDLVEYTGPECQKYESIFLARYWQSELISTSLCVLNFYPSECWRACPALNLRSDRQQLMVVAFLVSLIPCKNPPNIIGLHLRSCQVEAVHPERARFCWRRLRPWQRTCAGGVFWPNWFVDAFNDHERPKTSLNNSSL